MTAPLTPDSVSCTPRNRGRLPIAFAPRFFLAAALGIIWVVPVWWSTKWVALLIVWNALVVTAWLWDLARLPAPSAFKITRRWNGPLILGRSVSTTLVIEQSGKPTLQVFAIDELAPSLRGQVPQFVVTVPSNGQAGHEYNITPRQRGDAIVGSVYLRYQTGFGFAERWAEALLTQTVCVLPDISEANQQALYLIRSRQIEIQKRRHRDPGLGREFDALREYREGDDLREVCWPATARRHSLVTRTFQAERSQTVWVMVDSGRLLRTEVVQAGRDFHLSKLDYAVDAALGIARVAAQFGDRVGALAYGRRIQYAIPASPAAGHIREWVETLARVRSESTEANHALAARVLLQKQTRRALVMWITDFPETPTLPDVVEYAAQIGRRHLVLFAAVSQPDLAYAARRVPETEQEMYRGAAALALLQRREVLIRSLRQQGVLAMEIVPGKLTTALVNEYLTVKDRNMI